MSSSAGGDEAKAATRIQALYRGKRDRKRVAGLRPPPPKGPPPAQKAVPRPPARDEAQAATKIQAIYRGKRDRKRVAKLRPPPPKGPPPQKQSTTPTTDEAHAATKIQAIYRGRRDRRRVSTIRKRPPPPPPRPPQTEEDAAAARIQAIYRGRRVRVARAQVPRPLPKKPRPPPPSEEDAAATKMQALFRGRRDRKRVAAKKRTHPPLPPNGVAPPVQRSLKSVPSNRSLPPGVRRASKPKLGVKLKRKATDVVVKDLPSKGEEHAATKIQSVFRGRRDRRRVASMRPPPPAPPPARDEAAEHKSATRIQAVFRGKKARRQVAAMPRPPPPKAPPAKPAAPSDEEHAKASKIQALFRGRKARRDVKQRRKRSAPRPPANVAPPKPAAAPAAAPQHIPRPANAPKGIPRPKVQPPLPNSDAALQRELNAYKAKTHALEARVASLSSQVASYRKQMTQMTKVHRQIDSLQRENKKLKEKLEDAEEDVRERGEEVKAAEEAVEQANVEIRLLEQQIQKEVDDFETLRDTLQEKEDVIGQSVATEFKLTQELKVARMEQTRLRGLVKARDDRIEELTPDMVDAGCDAKPLDDSLAIKLRDDEIAIKIKAMAELSEQNLKLMGNLDMVEEEIKRMQEDLMVRNREVQAKKQEALEYKKETIRLTNIIKRKKGQEYAMDVAAKQNTQLLQLLEAAEKKVDEANDSKEEAWAQVADMRAKMLDAVRDAAQHEAVAVTESRDARQMARQVAVLKTRLDKTSETMTQDLREVKQEARLQVESVQSELQMRRAKQYETLHKLGRTEELLRAQTRRGDDAVAKARTLQQRVLELEAQVMQNRQWRQQEAEEATAQKERLDAQIGSLKTRLERAEKDRQDTKKQMMDMGQTVVELAERQRASEQRTNAAEELTRSKDGEIAALKERIAQLLDDAMRHDRKIAEVQVERNELRQALHESQSQHASLLDKTKGLGLGGKGGSASGMPSFASTTTTVALVEPSRSGSASLGKSGSLTSLAGGATVGGAGATVGSGWKGNSVMKQTAPGGARELHLQKQIRMLQARCKGVQDSKRRVFERAVTIQAALARAHATLLAQEPASNEAMTAEEYAKRRPPTMVLRNLGITDEDVALLVDMLSSPVAERPFSPPARRGGRSRDAAKGAKGGISAKDGVVDAAGVPTAFGFIRSVDLRDNLITDTGAMLLAGVLAGQAPGDSLGAWLGFLDLRGNQVSPAGIRALAEAVRCHQRLAVHHVYVGRDGLVQALGVPPITTPRGTVRPHGAAGVVGDEDLDVRVIAVIDVTHNSGSSTGDAALAARELRGRVRASRLGAFGGKSTVASAPSLSSTAPGFARQPPSQRTLPAAPTPNRVARQGAAVALMEGDPPTPTVPGERGNLGRPGADISRGTGSTFHARSKRAAAAAAAAAAAGGAGAASFATSDGRDDRVARLLDLAAADDGDNAAGVGAGVGAGTASDIWESAAPGRQRKQQHKQRRQQPQQWAASRSQAKGSSKRRSQRETGGTLRRSKSSRGRPTSSGTTAKGVAAKKRAKTPGDRKSKAKPGQRRTTSRRRARAKTKAPAPLPDVELNESQILPRLSLA